MKIRAWKIESKIIENNSIDCCLFPILYSYFARDYHNRPYCSPAFKIILEMIVGIIAKIAKSSVEHYSLFNNVTQVLLYVRKKIYIVLTEIHLSKHQKNKQKSEKM